MSASDALVMSSDGVSPQSNVEAGQVKFSKDSESVDAKVEQKLIGLTKEQLERYRNDPFWKPVRYTLFALFWLAWIAMFVSAIVIVVLSPKCAEKREKEWHETNVAYQLYVPTFRDTDSDGVGDFNGVKDKLNDLRRVGVQTIWPTPILATNKNDFKVGEIVDNVAVDPRFGKEEELRELIDKAHDLSLHVIADLPLTVSEDSKFASKSLPNPGHDKTRLLNIKLVEARDVVKKAAAKLIEWGVDGLYFAQYGLKYQYPTGDLLDQIATEIRTEQAANFHDPKSFIFIASEASTKGQRAINYYTRSLAHFDATPDVCRASGILQCLSESAGAGIHQIKQNETSLPIWELGDISHSRLDTLLRNVSKAEYSSAQSLITAIQLFLPGSAKIFYGEELSLPSVGKMPQFPQMLWDETPQGGFSEHHKDSFFSPIVDPQGRSYAAQMSNLHSPLKAFKKLTQLRARDEVFADGNFTSSSVGGLYVFTRTFYGEDKAYLLVANWPNIGERSPKQYAVDSTIVSGWITTLADLVIDQPPNSANPSKIEIGDKLTLGPFEYIVLRLKVTAESK